MRLEVGRARSEAAPYARTDAPLGGYFVIQVASLEEAVRWASRIPAAGGAVEVAPRLPSPRNDAHALSQRAGALP